MARLTSQLKSVIGSATVMIVGANLSVPFFESIESMQCEVLVDKQGAKIIRQTSKCQYESFPQWNETVQFHCCVDWDIQFFVSIVASSNENDGESVELCSDLVDMETNGVSKIPLRIGTKQVGELEISLVFYPNYQSFKYLSVGCYLSEQLPYSLVNTILSDLNKSTMEERMLHADSEAEDDIISVIAAVDNFTTFLTEEDTYNRELCTALNLKTQQNNRASRMPAQQQGYEHERTRSYSSLLAERNAELPSSIPLHKVAMGAKCFLMKLLGKLPQVRNMFCVLCGAPL